MINLATTKPPESDRPAIGPTCCMPRKSDQRFGALPARSKRLQCDFSAMRGARAVRLIICRVTALQTSLPEERPSENSHVTPDELSGSRCVKTRIKSGWMEMTRGELNGTEGCRKDKQIRRRTLISNSTEAPLVFRGARGGDAAAAVSLLSWNCFLFCLTGAAIFDNRHGLLKKFDSARAAKPLSQPLKPHE